MHRGNAKQTAHGHGVVGAIADYDVAIVLMERQRQALGEDWPVPWRNHLAARVSFPVDRRAQLAGDEHEIRS
jgi:hypothetical protein